MTGEKKEIVRVNDKMVKVNIAVEKVYSNQQLYDLWAQFKQKEITLNQQQRKLDRAIEELHVEMAFIETMAKDCEKRIPKAEK